MSINENKFSLNNIKIIIKKYPNNKPFKPSIKLEPLINTIKQNAVKKNL